MSKPVSGSSSSRRENGESPVTEECLAFFIPDLTLGGAEQVTVNIVNGLARRGYNVELLLSRTEGTLQSELVDEVTVVRLPPSRTPIFGVATHLPALLAYLRRTEPVALFPHLAHVSVVCLIAKRLSGTDTAVVPTHHKAYAVAPDRSGKDRIVRGLIPKLYPTADRIIAVSGGVADSISTRTPVDREDISVLYNPIEIETIQQRARDPVEDEWIEDETLDVLFFVGRIEQQKDLETWLRTFERVHERYPDSRAVIAGKGSKRAELREFAAELGLADVVSMPGYVENPYGYMRRSDVFLLSSAYEGLPTVLIEALAVGCPVVATDCPSGPREILADGEYGRLAPVGDVGALADAITTTLDDPPSPEKLVGRAEAFGTDSALDDFEQFFEEFLFSRGTGDTGRRDA